MYAIILAGGSGTRLWPYSRSELPKQFLTLGGERTMLQETVDRVLPLIPVDQIYIATGARYYDLVKTQLPALPAANILLEPVGRGTAPCIGAAALLLRHRQPNATMAVLSADHHITKAVAFREALVAAEAVAAEGQLVTLGIEASEPSSAYGYIQRGEELGTYAGHLAYRVAAFHEKPPREQAERLIQSGASYWNAGMFVWQAEAILAELQRHQPQLSAQLSQIERALATPGSQQLVLDTWTQMDTIAIDIAVLEQSDRAVVLPVDIGRSDLGDWSSLATVLPQDSHGNAVVGRHVGLDTTGSLIFSAGKQLVATIGLEDMIVVETEDAVLVCPRSRAQDVKALLAQMLPKTS